MAIALGVLAAWVATYFGEFREIFSQWVREPEESHGVLVAIAVPILIWLRRDRLSASDRGRPLSIIGCSLAIAAVAFCHAASVDAVAWMILPMVALLATAVALGAGAAITLAAPIGYFLLALPIWGVAAAPFQWLTAKASTAILALLHVPVIVNGNIVSVPAGTFEIAEGCSGIRFLVVTMALAFMFSMIERLPWRRTLMLLAVAIGAAVVTNWLRVATIIYIGQATHMRSPLIADHYTLGWWMFAAAFVPLGFFAMRLVRSAPTAARDAPAPLRPGSLPGALAAAGLLGAAALWSWAVDHGTPGRSLTVAAPALPGWAGPTDPHDGWRPDYAGVGAEWFGAFRRNAQIVSVYVAAYDRQSRQGKLIGYGSSLAGAGWIDDGAVQARAIGAAQANVDERVLSDAWGAHRVVWSWYEVEGRRMLSPTRVKFREGMAAFGAGRRSAIIALSSPCVPNCDAAREALVDAYSSGLDRFGLDLR